MEGRRWRRARIIYHQPTLRLAPCSNHKFNLMCEKERAEGEDDDCGRQKSFQFDWVTDYIQEPFKHNSSFHPICSLTALKTAESLPLSLVPPSSMVICSASSDRDSSMVWLERSVNDRRFLILFIFSIAGQSAACGKHRTHIINIHSAVQDRYRRRQLQTMFTGQFRCFACVHGAGIPEAFCATQNIPAHE